MIQRPGDPRSLTGKVGATGGLLRANTDRRLVFGGFDVGDANYFNNVQSGVRHRVVLYQHGGVIFRDVPGFGGDLGVMFPVYGFTDEVEGKPFALSGGDWTGTFSGVIQNLIPDAPPNRNIAPVTVRREVLLGDQVLLDETSPLKLLRPIPTHGIAILIYGAWRWNDTFTFTAPRGVDDELVCYLTIDAVEPSKAYGNYMVVLQR